MTFEDYLVELREDVARFEKLKLWRVGMAKTPDCYPTEMEPGEWDEQFMAFCHLMDGDTQ